MVLHNRTVLRIAEIFTSIQGEGIWVGTPSTFVRVSGCNLRCAWCDTPYASWTPEGPTLELSAIIDQVPADVAHVVITGGEPMLFDGVIPLAEALADRGRTITIETAGTLFRDLPCHLMSISPKMSNSTPAEEPWRSRHEATRHRPEVVSELVKSYPYQLKFVVQSEADLDEIERYLELVGPVEAGRVLLMAEGRDAATLHYRASVLVPYAIRRGWRLTPRWQIDLFGDTRGT